MSDESAPAVIPQPLTTATEVAGLARETLWANSTSPLYVAGLVVEVLRTSAGTTPPIGGQYAVTIISG